jgi:hypothetical protein
MPTTTTKPSFCPTNDIVHWAIRFVLLVYAAFVADRLPLRVAILFDNTIVRAVLVVLVLALGTCDPASAILLSIGLVLSIQSANRHHLGKIANHAVVVGRETFATASGEKGGASAEAEEEEEGGALHEEGGVKSDIVNHGTSTQSHADASSGDHHNPEHHSTEGFTSNSAPPSLPASSRMFISPEQLSAMQTNQVADNQETEVRTWKQEIGPQGLGTSVAGFSFGGADAPAPFQ